MDETPETKTGLLHKKQDELTVADSIKISLGSVAVFTVAYLGVVGGVVGYNKFCDWRIRRAQAKEFPAPIETTSKEV